jgi:uncharacterized membrane protein
VTPTRGEDRLERTGARVLWLGVLTSSTCLVVGVVAALARGEDSVSRLLLVTGLMLLMITPSVRVAMSAAEYLRHRDWLLLALTLIVLAELAASVFAALHGRAE